LSSFLIFPMCTKFSANLILDLIALITSRKRNRLRNSSLCNILVPVTANLKPVASVRNVLFSDVPCCYPREDRPVSVVRKCLLKILTVTIEMWRSYEGVSCLCKQSWKQKEGKTETWKAIETFSNLRATVHPAEPLVLSKDAEQVQRTSGRFMVGHDTCTIDDRIRTVGKLQTS
jgi:hypothetical protein